MKGREKGRKGKSGREEVIAKVIIFIALLIFSCMLLITEKLILN